jgi:hypothetical protein
MNEYLRRFLRKCSNEIILSRVEGNVDLINSNGGVFFSAYRVDECKQAITKILYRDNDYMGNNNKAVIKKYSVDAVLDIMRKIYL